MIGEPPAPSGRDVLSSASPTSLPEKSSPAGEPTSLASLEADFGDPLAELNALESGLALATVPQGDVILLSGPDRRSFLHRFCTADLVGIDDGDGAFGFITHGKGGVLADFILVPVRETEPESKFDLLEVPLGRASLLAEHLNKYLILDRAMIGAASEPGTEPDAWCRLVLGGPATLDRERLSSALEADAVVPVEAWQCQTWRLAGHEVIALRHPLRGFPALDLWLRGSAVAEVEAHLLGSLPRLRRAGLAATECLRIQAGLARWGADYDETNFPQETGHEEHAVSYRKGCYLGQEVVARIHFRGQAQRLMSRLVGDVPDQESSVPSIGTEVFFDGRSAGRWGSSRCDPRDGRLHGLAVVHRRAADTGTQLSLKFDSGAVGDVFVNGP